MSKYKLLQRYPSLPKSWKVGEIVQQSYSPHCYSSISSDINYRINIPKEEVENNPDFWEEIISKKYEVLSIKDKTYSNKILKVKNYIVGEGAFLESTCRTEDFNSNRDSYEYISLNYNIHSIKRTSDGEVFTVGDRIKHKTTYKVGEILSIHVGKWDVYFATTYRNIERGTRLDNAVPAKKLLFTTKDGVDIYEGDKCWAVDKTDLVLDSSKSEGYNGSGSWLFYFSTKEKAEEWMDLNKPKYSKKNVMSIIDKSLKLDYESVFGKLVDEEYVIDLNKVKEQLNE